MSAGEGVSGEERRQASATRIVARLRQRYEGFASLVR